MEDVRWLGFDWDDRLYLRLRLLRAALRLGRAADQGRQGLRLRPDGRRDPRAPRHAHRAGQEQPLPRPLASTENLDLFARMRAGEFPDGSRTLRAKIDMASPNLNMRDPVMYRILHADAPPHRRQVVHLPDVRLRARPVATRSRASRTRSARWSSRTTGRCTTGSSTTLGIYHPQQIEFARLNLTYTVMSKRKLLELVQGEARQRLGRPADADDLRPAPPRLHARGDPRLLRADRRGQVRQRRSTSALLEHCLREDLNKRAPRVMAVLRPLQGRDRRTIPKARSRSSTRSTTPRTPAMGTRKVPFSRVLYIEQDDFREDAAEEVLPPVARPRGAAALRATSSRAPSVVKDPTTGEVDRAALHLRPGHARRQRARRPQGEGHDPLGLGRARASRPRCGCTTTCSPSPIPDDVPEGVDYKANLNPKSLEVLTGCTLEPSLAAADAGRPLPVRAARLLLRRSQTSPARQARSSTAR